MEKEKLPNATMVIVLSVLGYLCCCFAGLGIIPSAIAFFMANKSQKIYETNPELFNNISAIKTGRIVAIIVLVLNILFFAYLIFWISQVGWSEWSEEFSRKWQENLDANQY
jgi:hypothetical protein